jgi:hypothetical protein
MAKGPRPATLKFTEDGAEPQGNQAALLVQRVAEPEPAGRQCRMKGECGMTNSCLLRARNPKEQRVVVRGVCHQWQEDRHQPSGPDYGQAPAQADDDRR